MEAYSEFLDVISLTQIVSEGRPVMGAYSECVDVTKSRDLVQADADFPPLGFVLHPTSDRGKLRRSMSNTCPCV